MQIRDAQARANAQLNKLSPSELSVLVSQSDLMACRAGEILHEAAHPFTHAYFPLQGLMAIFLVMKSGHAVETGFFDRAGSLGSVEEDLSENAVRLVATTAGAVIKMPKPCFLRAIQQNHDFRDAVIRHQWRMTRLTQQIAACNALHRLEERICRWMVLVMVHSDNATIAITQEQMSHHLGVDRGRLNAVLRGLLTAGIVAFPHRGEIRVLDRNGLQAVACECHETLC